MFTEEQVKELSKKLDPAVIRERAQGGRTFSYIEGWHAIAEANRIFGHGEWIRETLELTENTRPTTNKNGNHVVSFRAKVRIHVNGIYRDGTGHGSGVAANIHDAYESAVKEAETDAMKRALMTFGNPFGLALYDKQQTNVGIEEKVDWKAISRNLMNELNETCLDSGSLLEFQDKHAQTIGDMPKTFCATLEQHIEQRAEEIKKGNVKLWPYRYEGTQEAFQSFRRMASELLNIRNMDELTKWHLKNHHMIESLSVLDKSQKYKKEGKHPKERIESQVKKIMNDFQEKQAAE